MVSYDYRTGSKCPIPDAVLRALEALEAQTKKPPAH
jgi:hypothetical protein